MSLVDGGLAVEMSLVRRPIMRIGSVRLMRLIIIRTSMLITMRYLCSWGTHRLLRCRRITKESDGMIYQKVKKGILIGKVKANLIHPPM